MEELMNIKEASQYLKLNHNTVYKLAKQRRLPAIKVGGNWRFKKDILDEWLKQQAGVNKGSVLIVDDDEMVQEVLKEMVSNQGYDVKTTDNGESALELLSQQHFDLLFLDLKLSGLSGIEILEEIKKKDRDVVIVVVTGYADEPIALKAMSLGPLLLVHKPFREKDILEILNIVMRRKTV